MAKRPSHIALPLAVMLLTPLSAFAFTSPNAGWQLQGPSRTIVGHDSAQLRLSESHAAWQHFLQAEGGSWQILWDEAASTPHRIWGSGLDLGTHDDTARAVNATRGFVRKHAALVGASPDELQLRSAELLEGLLMVSFQRTYQGIPVHEAVADFIFEHGRLVSMGFDTYPETSVNTTPALRRQEALDIAESALPVRHSRSTVAQPGELVILPLEDNGVISYHLAWKSTITTAAPEYGEWISFVDAHTGAILSAHNNIAFISGAIDIEYEERTVGDDIVAGPAQHMDVDGGIGGSATTDNDGQYDANGSDFTLRFEGPYYRVTSQKTRNASTSTEGGDFTWEWRSQATPAEASVFVGLGRVRQRALAASPTLPELQQSILGIANKIGSCNAFYNGNVNFLSETPFCNNTGRIQDVIFHEYGHHYHYSLVAAGVIAGDIGEGSGDYLSATITDSPRIAPGFSKTGGGDGAIREIETDRVYPGDVTGSSHTDGLIWAGAMWDLRALLMDDLGDLQGMRRADSIFAKALMQGPRLSNCYQAVLVADDDDGNLANGTPNKDAIDTAFAAHGLN